MLSKQLKPWLPFSFNKIQIISYSRRAALFLINGKKYTPEETQKLFSNFSLGKREKVALSFISISENNKTIVDLGCLFGFFAKKLRDDYPKNTIIAGDYLDENLEIAKFLHPDMTSNFKKLNAYNLDLKSLSVHCLLFQAVIEHLEGAAHAIKEINRVLVKGGELILSTPTAYYWRDMWQSFKYELVRKYFKKHLPLSDAIYFQEHEWDRHIYCWTPTTLYTLLKVNGFDYVTHAYCQDGSGRLENALLKLFPFLSPTIILKVKKTSNAPEKIV